MCVYHDQLDMYDHLVEFCGASEHVRNNRGMTPMLLAASLGKLEAFQHIYNKRRKVRPCHLLLVCLLCCCAPADAVTPDCRSGCLVAAETSSSK